MDRRITDKSAFTLLELMQVHRIFALEPRA